MRRTKDDPVREAIFERIGVFEARDLDGRTGKPLDWDDIGVLCQGLTFANRPMFEAIKPIQTRYSLGPRGVWMLNLISAGVVYPHELSDVFMIGRSLISAELVRLTEAGLVESRTGADDRRRSELALTEEGEKALKEVRGELESRLKLALADYTPEEVRLLIRMLSSLRDSVLRK